MDMRFDPARCMKIMMRPGEQFVIRRMAGAMFRQACDENGLEGHHVGQDRKLPCALTA